MTNPANIYILYGSKIVLRKKYFKENKGDKTMKKVLLTSAVALAAFGFAQNASAATVTRTLVSDPSVVPATENSKVVASYTFDDSTNQFVFTYANGQTETKAGEYVHRQGQGDAVKFVPAERNLAEAVRAVDRSGKEHVEMIVESGDVASNPAFTNVSDNRNPVIHNGFIRYDRTEANKFTKRARIIVVDGGGKPVQGATIDIQIIGVNGDRKQNEVFTVTTDVNGDADFSENDYYMFNGSFVKEAVDANGNKLGYPEMHEIDQLIEPAKGRVEGNFVKEPVTTDDESQALKREGAITFKEGEKLKYRVAKTASDHKEVVELTGELVIGSDMYTNGRVVLPYKDDSRAAQIGDKPTAAQYGWANTAEGWKYFENAKAVTGWKQVDGSWYYLNDKGVMQTGWVNVSGTWYYLNKSGAMVTGWVQDSGTWYFLEASGAMKASQWFQVGDKWYYVNGSGALKVNQWFQVGDKWYYATESGAIAVNTTVGGYTVDASGAWVK